MNEDQLRSMTDIISHRGPDSEGFHIDNCVGLGFRRLSIIDLANGSQPMCDETSDIWVVFNGEIYNYLELREWLISKGYTFTTNSDTETLLHLYKEVGFDTPKHLRGMFGFVIWDKSKNLIFGARDHFGIKPIYWTETNSAIVICSEIKSILELHGFEREVDQNSFYHYLTFQYVPDPYTMFKGIHKIPPGHSFIVQNDKIDIESYWQPVMKPNKEKSFDYFKQQTREILEDSVQKHTICDVNWGAFLSSGVDSSSIVGLLSRHQRIKTFSVGFAIPGYNELEYARRTAQYFGTEHYEHEISGEEYLQELPNLIWHQDEPVADPSAVALYFVAKLAREHVKVVLSGEGADEFFAGYNIYREPLALSPYESFVPTKVRKWIGRMATTLPEGLKGRGYLIRGSQRLQDRFFGNALIFSEDMKKSLLSNYQGKNNLSPYQLTHPYYSKVDDVDDISKMQFLDIKTWLCGNILMKADKMTMANSLELRVPFVDTKVFDLASTIPTHFQMREGTTKYVLRQAMKDLLPSEIQSRKKLGFPVPIRVWLKDKFYDWAKTIIADSEIDFLINKNMVLGMLESHKEGRNDFSRQIWSILIFIMWYRIYIVGFNTKTSNLEAKRKAE